VKRRVAWFLVGALAFWAAAAALAYGLGDSEAVPCIAAAAGLCLLPSIATLAWATWAATQSPEQQLAATLGRTGLRMFFVLGVGLLLTKLVPYFSERQQGFWLWILVFYLFDLGLEMALLLAGRPMPEKQDSQRS